MPTFRAYCLDTDERIYYGENIEAADLESAISEARKLCNETKRGSAHGIELWLDERRLFTTANFTDS